MATAVAKAEDASSPVFRWPPDADVAERLPPAARSKLLALRAEDENAGTLLRELSSRRNDTYRAKGEAEARLGSLTLPHLAARTGGTIKPSGAF
jgi:hypothetical protein